MEAAIAMYLAGKSMPEIARHLGAPYNRVRTFLLRAGVKLRTLFEAQQIAAKHRIYTKPPGRKKGSKLSPEGRAKFMASRALSAAGVSLKPNGYIEYTRGPNKHRSVHVVTMEQHIGRRLNKNEVVHHIDHNRSNNELSNLQLMTRAEHASLHRREHRNAS